MADIKVVLHFNYANDSSFSSVPPVGTVNEIDPSNQKEFFKNCGWYSGWGKELTGIDLSQNGGNALIGEWMFARKTVRWTTHPLAPSALVVDEIEMHLDSLKIGKSPMIVSFSLDSMRVAIAVVKTDPFVGPGTFAQNVIKNASIPYPANGAWVTHPGFQKGRPVSAFSSAKNIVDVGVHCETDAGFEVSFIAIETSGDAAIFPPAASNPLLAGVASCKNPYSVVAQAYDNGFHKGMIQFDMLVGAPMTKYPRKSQSAATPVPARPKFVAPDEITLPDLPSGYTWALNARGVVLLEKNGDLFFPHEVFDLIQAEHDAQLSAEAGDHYPEGQVAKVRALFDYMESVGNGLALNYRVLREFNP